MDNLVLTKIDQLIVANPELVGKNKEGWEPLTAPPFDFEKYKYGTPAVFQVSEGAITLEEGSFLLPFKRTGAYEVRLTVTVNKDASDARPALIVHLPVGENRKLSTRYYVDQDHVADIEGVEAMRLIEPAPGKVGEKTKLTYQFAEADGTAIAMLYNGRAGVKWQGSIEALAPIGEEVLQNIPQDAGPVMFIWASANVTIHAVEFRERR